MVSRPGETTYPGDELSSDGVCDFVSGWLLLEGMQEHVVVVDSVSKRYSMCGARIGYVVTKNKEVRSCIMKFAQARLSPPTLAQIASEAALETPLSYLKEVNTEYNKRRLVLKEGLSAIDGVRVSDPQGAFYLIAELPVSDAEHFSQWLLEHFEFEGDGGSLVRQQKRSKRTPTMRWSTSVSE